MSTDQILTPYAVEQIEPALQAALLRLTNKAEGPGRYVIPIMAGLSTEDAVIRMTIVLERVSCKCHPAEEKR